MYRSKAAGRKFCSNFEAVEALSSPTPCPCNMTPTAHLPRLVHKAGWATIFLWISLHITEPFLMFLHKKMKEHKKASTCLILSKLKYLKIYEKWPVLCNQESLQGDKYLQNNEFINCFRLLDLVDACHRPDLPVEGWGSWWLSSALSVKAPGH